MGGGCVLDDALDLSRRSDRHHLGRNVFRPARILKEPPFVARRVFFSFHYQRDIVRASQVRNSWVTQDRQTAGFLDAAAWEKVKRGGDAAIEAWIEDQLNGTSVTVVLIGAE